MDSYYPYSPSKVTAIIFAILYTAAFVGTFVQWIRHRSWVWVVMIVASSMEAVGYLTRIHSISEPDNRTIFIVQFCMVILAPVVMAAAFYVIFGRIVYHVVPLEAMSTKLLWVPPRFVTPIFVACDTFALFVQLIGAVIVSGTQPTDPNAKSKINRGKYIAITGIVAQVACFGFFSIIAIRFHFISRRFDQDFERRYGVAADSAYLSIDDRKRKLNRNWPVLLRVVNITCLLLLVRSIYRICNFALGNKGYLSTHEWPIYVFDAVPCLPCVALYIFWHPARYLPYLGFRLPKHVRQGQRDYRLSQMRAPN